MNATSNNESPPRVYERSTVYARSVNTRLIRDRQVLRLAAKVRSVVPWLEPSDQPAVRAWCELEILARQAFAALRAAGVVNETTGEGRRLLNDYRKIRLAQLAFTREIGMTPLARQALKTSRDNDALDVAQLASSIEDAQTTEVGDDDADSRASGGRGGPRPPETVGQHPPKAPVWRFSARGRE